jgi:hypothetical protein
MLDRILTDQTDIVCDFVHNVLFGCDGDFGMCYALGFLDKFGMLEAGVVFHNYCVRTMSVTATIAAINSSWMTRQRISLVGRYVFDQLKCNSLVSHYYPDSKNIRHFMTTIGGTEYLIKGLGGYQKDMIMHVLLADEARQSKFWR